MSGILGIFAKQGEVQLDTFERGVRELGHRGREGRDTWVDPAHRVALGVARLIPGTSEPESQLAAGGGAVRVVFDGRLYGVQALRDRLSVDGHPAAGPGDDGLVAALYEAYGVRCLELLRGEFAFLVWDRANQVLLAARDRVGGRPLHFAEIEGTLCVASEAKALFAAGVPARWDRESFFQATFVFYDQDRSLFRDVFQVPAGHYLLATRYRSELVSYWDYDYPLGVAEPPPEQELVTRVREALSESVRLRIPGSEPVACFLSGGIDSCTVLGVAAAASSKPVGAFTASFTAENYDEGLRAEEMAKYVGADFHRIHIEEDQLADSFADMIWHCESLIHTLSPVANYLIAREMRRSGYRIALSGHGADEIFAGYPHFRRDMLLHNSAGQEPELIGELLRKLQGANQIAQGLTLPSSGGVLERSRSMLGFVPSWIETRAENGLRYRELFDEGFAREFAERDPLRVFLGRFDLGHQLLGREPVNQSQYLWNRTMLTNNQLTIFGDRVEMAHGIEGRLPYLDHPLIEMARNIPVRLKIRGGIEKWVLREAARSFVTEAVYRREKHGFIAPPSSVDLRSKLHQLIHDTLRGPALRAMPFFDSRKVSAVLDRLSKVDDQERRAISVNLTMLMSACCLQERFGLTN